MLLLQETETATWVQTLDETVCISQSINIPGKGMNPTMG